MRKPVRLVRKSGKVTGTYVWCGGTGTVRSTEPLSKPGLRQSLLCTIADNCDGN